MSPASPRRPAPGGSPWRRLATVAAAVALLGLGAAPAAAQQDASLRLAGADGTPSGRIEVARHRGYAAVPASVLRALGWSVGGSAGTVTASRDGALLELRAGDPWFHWDGELLQLVDEPYRYGDGVWVPLQLLTDFLPSRMEGAYAFDGAAGTLKVLEGPAPSASRRPDPAATPAGPPPASGGSASRSRPAPDAPPVPRVVIIDPGHGGRDPGSLGPGGTREKDVALAVGLALARELRRRPGLEVHMTREDDELAPLWKRGQWATDVKGSRPGVFISLHTNAVGGSRQARGFETYFLSDARTDHERRVAALENAPLALGRDDDSLEDDPGLGFILKELKNLDNAHWSSLLAELAQDGMDPVHPGPNRGVKQAPLAVLTNALMPAVLVELGFITHPAEARLMARPDFQRDVARVLADAVEAFFQRYPPGGAETGKGRP